jgi:hypothetical protein
MRVWDQLSAKFGDFRARAGADWHRNEWDFRVVATGPAKVHLDVQFTRYRIDNSVIGSYRSCGSSLTPAEIEQWRHDELRG